MNTTGDKTRLWLCLNVVTVFIFLFYFTRETFIEREPGESANDRNDRAIRVAAKWYSEHLKGLPDGDELRVVLLTNDLGNREKAKENNLLVFKCKNRFSD